MDIVNLRPSKASTLAFCFGNVFVVGLSFFLLDRKMYMTIDLRRLLGVCVGISVPMLLANGYIGVLLRIGQKRSDDDKDSALFAFSAEINVLVFTATLLVCYFYKPISKGFISHILLLKPRYLLFAYYTTQNGECVRKIKSTLTLDNSLLL